VRSPSSASRAPTQSSLWTKYFAASKSHRDLHRISSISGKFSTEADRLIDQVMLAVHRAPTSYTGEDLVEISCHGGTLVTAKVLEACLHAGARAAGRANLPSAPFLNGKMDLTQAEAVIDLIRAKTDLALRSATEQSSKAGSARRSGKFATI